MNEVGLTQTMHQNPMLIIHRRFHHIPIYWYVSIRIARMKRNGTNKTKSNRKFMHKVVTNNYYAAAPASHWITTLWISKLKHGMKDKGKFTLSTRNEQKKLIKKQNKTRKENKRQKFLFISIVVWWYCRWKLPVCRCLSIKWNGEKNIRRCCRRGCCCCCCCACLIIIIIFGHCLSISISFVLHTL